MASRIPLIPIAIPIRAATTVSSRSAAGNGWLNRSVACPAPISASMVAAVRTARSIAPVSEMALTHEPSQYRSDGVTAENTAAAADTDNTRRQETMMSQRRPARILGSTPATVARPVTAMTSATSGGIETSGGRSSAYPNAALVAMGARLRLRSTRNCTISPIATRTPKVTAYGHSVTPRRTVRASAARPTTPQASTMTKPLPGRRSSAPSELFI
ncbi:MULTISPECIES: hypothetical protein [unclassified Kribbella]|uniref:hypothetical protein n=1 Tax=unclassified Kribbella TaxID=2644121 RepID=UPI00301AD257